MGGKFGTPEYAEEELRAEIASMFVAQDLELTATESHIQNNSAYIQHWKSKITQNPNVLFTAIADAERITKFIMAKEMQGVNTAEEVVETAMVETEEERKAKMERLSQIEEEKSEVFMPPSEIVAKTNESAAVDMTGRGVEAITNADDREVIESAKKSKYGEKFMSLWNGEKVFKSEEADERSLMARIAMRSNGVEQTLRLFRLSGQFRDEKPTSYYERMARDETEFVTGLKNKTTLSQAHIASGNRSRYSNTKA